MKPHAYNLDIQKYSLDEIFELFDFDIHTPIHLEQIKIAKRKVLMIHPDKSKLPTEYFLFYKKAFEIIVQRYESQMKITTEVPDIKIDYIPLETTTDLSTKNKEQLKTKINDLSSTTAFQSRFNEMFEQIIQKPNTDKNEWFKTQESLYDTENIKSAKDIGQKMEQIKRKQKQDGMIQYTGVV
jgi:hypothetical protein